MDERPLPAYATVSGAFTAVLLGFLVAARTRLPERIGFGDVVRIGLASYKLGRIVAKEPVTEFVRAPVTEDAEAREPKREGAARVLGELVTCPYCIGLWIAAGFSYALVLFPRQTRFATSVFGAQAIADFLNAGFVKVRSE